MVALNPTSRENAQQIGKAFEPQVTKWLRRRGVVVHEAGGPRLVERSGTPDLAIEGRYNVLADVKCDSQDTGNVVVSGYLHRVYMHSAELTKHDGAVIIAGSPRTLIDDARVIPCSIIDWLEESNIAERRSSDSGGTYLLIPWRDEMFLTLPKWLDTYVL